jgi:hypothetical protein
LVSLGDEEEEEEEEQSIFKQLDKETISQVQRIKKGFFTSRPPKN